MKKMGISIHWYVHQSEAIAQIVYAFKCTKSLLNETHKMQHAPGVYIHLIAKSRKTSFGSSASVGAEQWEKENPPHRRNGRNCYTWQLWMKQFWLNCRRFINVVIIQCLYTQKWFIIQRYAHTINEIPIEQSKEIENRTVSYIYS